jgi:DNA-directed RNA polymerase subunit RPC12/RpoP
MYCRNCGNKLLDTDKFCNNCGSRVIFHEENSKEIKIEAKEDVTSQEVKTENNEKELPMNWWNFFLYIKFPLTIIVSLCSIVKAFNNIHGYEFNTFGQSIIVAFFLIDIVFIIYTALAFNVIIKRKKNGYILFIGYLFFEILYRVFVAVFTNYKTDTDFAENIIAFITVSAILMLPWSLPNYIYFSKRKKYFSN